MSIHEAVLQRKEDVADRTTAFHFSRPPGFSFKAGQAIDVVLPGPREKSAIRVHDIDVGTNHPRPIVLIRHIAAGLDPAHDSIGANNAIVAMMVMPPGRDRLLEVSFEAGQVVRMNSRAPFGATAFLSSFRQTVDGGIAR